MVNQLVDLFRQATGSWYAELVPIAQNLFVLLATITLIWSAIWWLLERDDPSHLLAAFLRRFLALGFFWAVLLNADTWIPAVIDGFSVAGQRAAGAAGGGIPRLNPGFVVDQGIAIASQLLEGANVTGLLANLGTVFVTGIAAVLTLLAFVAIAAQLVITLVEMYIVIGAGVLLLAFAATPWTMSFAERYFSYAVSVGIKLFVLYLILGLGSAIVAGWQGTLAQTNASVDALLAVVGASVIYMLLAWQVPALAGSLIGGGLALSLGGTMQASAAAAATVGSAGALAAAGAARLFRGTAALKETARFAAAHHRAGSSWAGATAVGVVELGGGFARGLTRRAVRPRWQTTAEVIQERRFARFGAATPPRRRPEAEAPRPEAAGVETNRASAEDHRPEERRRA